MSGDDKSKRRAGKDGAEDGKKIVARNKTVRARYEIVDVYEAGIILLGTEVKSVRNGGANLRDSYADVRNGEVFLENCHIAPYAFSNRFNHDPLRPRKLLLHKREITKLIGKVAERGYTLAPLDMYFIRGKIKISVGLGKGKRTIDRREEIKKREIDREMRREKNKYR